MKLMRYLSLRQSCKDCFSNDAGIIMKSRRRRRRRSQVNVKQHRLHKQWINRSSLEQILAQLDKGWVQNMLKEQLVTCRESKCNLSQNRCPFSPPILPPMCLNVCLLKEMCRSGCCDNVQTRKMTIIHETSKALVRSVALCYYEKQYSQGTFKIKLLLKL